MWLFPVLCRVSGGPGNAVHPTLHYLPARARPGQTGPPPHLVTWHRNRWDGLGVASSGAGETFPPVPGLPRLRPPVLVSARIITLITRTGFAPTFCRFLSPLVRPAARHCRQFRPERGYDTLGLQIRPIHRHRWAALVAPHRTGDWVGVEGRDVIDEFCSIVKADTDCGTMLQ